MEHTSLYQRVLVSLYITVSSITKHPSCPQYVRISPAVVDVYQEWAGPCSSMTGHLRRIKLELGDEFLTLAMVSLSTCIWSSVPVSLLFVSVFLCVFMCFFVCSCVPLFVPLCSFVCSFIWSCVSLSVSLFLCPLMCFSFWSCVPLPVPVFLCLFQYPSVCSRFPPFLCYSVSSCVPPSALVFICLLFSALQLRCFAIDILYIILWSLGERRK